MKRVLSIFLVAMLLLSNTCYAVDDWTKASPLGTNQAADIDTLQQANNTAVDRVLANYRENCAIYYISAGSVGIKAGEVVCSNSVGTLRKFRQNTSVTALTWANIDTGAEASGTTYYVYAVADADSANFTGMISVNATTPTGATYYKKLGSFYNNSSSNIANDDTLINYNNYYALKLGDLESKTTGTVYQASTDGFVMAIGYGGGDSAGGVQGYTDASNPPTTLVTQNSKGGGGEGPSASLGITMPVKKGDYWKTVTTGSDYGCYWMSLEREV